MIESFLFNDALILLWTGHLQQYGRSSLIGHWWQLLSKSIYMGYFLSNERLATRKLKVKTPDDKSRAGKRESKRGNDNGISHLGKRFICQADKC